MMHAAMRVSASSAFQQGASSKPCPCKRGGGGGTLSSNGSSLSAAPPLQFKGCSPGCKGRACPAAKLPSSAGGRTSVAPPPNAVAIFYATATGKTQEVADRIKEALGDAVAGDPVDIGDVADLAGALQAPGLDGLIVGAPTWNTGADEGRSGTAWDDVLPKVAGLDLKGQNVAVYGLGDQHSYGDYFCDAIQEIYDSFAAAGASMCGAWPTTGYEHSESKAETEPGMFCGLPLDEDNQGDLTEQRIAAWTQQVLQEMGVAAVKAAAS